MANDSYVTPQWLTAPLDTFDLDPCCAPDQPWHHAITNWTEDFDCDGLVRNWYGRVWLNPPYSHPSEWMARMAQWGNGITLVNVSTTTKWWQESVWGTADAVRFLNKRVYFWFYDDKPRKKKVKGEIITLQPTLKWMEADNPEKESALIAWGLKNVIALVNLDQNPDPRLAGRTIFLKEITRPTPRSQPKPWWNQILRKCTA